MIRQFVILLRSAIALHPKAGKMKILISHVCCLSYLSEKAKSFAPPRPQLLMNPFTMTRVASTLSSSSCSESSIQAKNVSRSPPWTPDFTFFTEVVFDASTSVDAVWNLVQNPCHWPFFCTRLLDVYPVLSAKNNEEGDAAANSNWCHHEQRMIWKATSGYQIRYDFLPFCAVDTVKRRAEGVGWGTIVGLAIFEIDEVHRDLVRLRFHWQGDLNAWWMHLPMKVASRVIIRNHDKTMNSFTNGMAQYLGTRVISSRSLSGKAALKLCPLPAPETLVAYNYAKKKKMTSTKILGDRIAGSRHGNWLALQRWRDLVLLHWRVPDETVRPFLPGGLEPEHIDGSAWLTIVCMRTPEMRLPWGYSLKGSAFSQVNVRTYATHQNTPGVVVARVDCQSARMSFLAGHLGLPYEKSKVRFTRLPGEFQYKIDGLRALEVVAKPNSPSPDNQRLRPSKMMERFSSFHEKGDSLVRGDLNHTPWHIIGADVVVIHNDLLSFIGVTGLNATRPDLVEVSPGTTGVFWKPEKASTK